ncbi:unnamed protein product [Scytosiphon promiscuus]
MPFRAVTLCRLCLNKKYPLWRQLLLSFLALSAVSMLLAMAVVMGTTGYIGNKAESEARASLEEQIKRHLMAASIEAAATIGERFRKLQYGVLDVTAFALRDALQQDFILDGGGEGYPVSPAHTDLRDTEIAGSAEANLVEFDRQNVPVDLSRSVYYYADSESYTVEVPADEQDTIARTARLDLLWPTMYINSNDTKAIILGIEFSPSSEMFRYFPGNHLSAVDGSRFACNYVEEDGSTAPCYDPTVRPWYTSAIADEVEVDADTMLGDVIITEPYIDAIGSEVDWLVTVARTVYSDAGSTNTDALGVAGVDVRLEQVQQTVESINFLDSGYSTLVTAEEGVVLASGEWNRTIADETTTVCDLIGGLCTGSGDDAWTALEEEIKDGDIKTFTFVSSDGSRGEGESILVAAPVETTFALAASGGEGTVTHYLLSTVPLSEIFEPVKEMVNLINDSTVQIIVTTAIVAACTLVAVALSVYFLARSITRPIAKMTRAARSIAKDGAKTNVFGSVASSWGAREAGSATGASSVDSRTAGRYTLNRTRALDYILCRGDDEISALAREFSLMITGLSRRGSAAEAKGLAESSAYPKNPFTAKIVGPLPTSPSAPAATAVGASAVGGGGARYSATAPNQRS